MCVPGQKIAYGQIKGGSLNLFTALAMRFIVHALSLISACTDDKPSLLDLRKFPGKDHNFDVMERIGVNYPDFGMFLLQDSDGSKVSALELTWQRASLPICRDIMKDWLQGKGKTPVTYATLLHCLRDADLHNLAKDIEDVLIS